MLVKGGHDLAAEMQSRHRSPIVAAEHQRDGADTGRGYLESQRVIRVVRVKTQATPK
jgi:hypothetical protein